ncbi:hypothetical protein [Flammeovirga agarivorans]|uniref:Outer membrane protein assembly factor BamE n=1 Tax=Flammeovirga agarivorans TaxID=2726742 RepID=A0A7X8SRH9_9BACT|nr:hypothetical protein [Flammeovirga agarivorans]NLR95082.1 hypothetical protein [Flammeovirga agarivorans]
MSIEVPIIILILAIPIYFLCNWFLKKRNIGDRKRRKYLAIFPTILISPIAYVGLICLWFISATYYPTNDFDKQVWESNPEKRYEMSENIIDSKILIGKTKQEIIDLLGNDFYSYNDNHIAYELGFVPRLFNIDSDLLDVYFENGKVIKVDQHGT